MSIEVVGFDPSYAKHFADLNYPWISETYGVEQHDRDVLDNPVESVIEPGGEIFFALADEDVAGTVAMIPFGEDAYELAKMAVDLKFRGRGIGDVLMEACIELARSSTRRKIILESNTKQAAAIQLYRKFGFQEIELDPNSHYARVNIRMELMIS